MTNKKLEQFIERYANSAYMMINTLKEFDEESQEALDKLKGVPIDVKYHLNRAQDDIKDAIHFLEYGSRFIQVAQRELNEKKGNNE